MPGGTSCPVVGIGASAGGLDAFIQLFENLPPDTGLAFVLVQHLDPRYQSKLTSILSSKISMPVSEIKEKMPVQPDHVYVMPSEADLEISGGIINLVPRQDTACLHMPIDFFLQSLAKDLGSAAIGVILSGNASDGSRGIKEIKAAGGITFAQEPQSARYAGMPHSAIDTGAVDYILPPVEIARDSELALKAAELRSLSKKNYQRKLKLPDAIVAVTTFVYSAVLVTRNIDDFKHLRDHGLRLWNPFDLSYGI